MPASHSHRRSARTGAEVFYFRDSEGPGRRTGGWSYETTELDAGLYDRQMAGISALISLANDVATVTRTGELRALGDRGGRRQGRLSFLWTRLREDQMTWNSLYLVLNTGLLAGFGFSFWIITAHLFSVDDVGKASALVSAAGLIGSFALVGLNTGMGKYLPDSRNPDGLISSGLAVVAIFGAVGGLFYLLLIPLIAPKLTFVDHSFALALGFALITSSESVNTLTDSVFAATRNAKYSTIVDGIIGGLGKNIVALALAGAGAYGLFVASASGFVLGSIASLVVIYAVMGIRLELRQSLKTLKPLFGFAGANYVGNVFNMIPGLAVPLILLDRLGSDSAAYFFVVFQIVQIVYAAALALEQTFLAEGSRADADMRGLKRRSVRMLVMFCVPAALGIIGVGHWLLLAFGRAYASNGFASLIILSLAAGPIAANYWYLTVLRLAGRLRAIVVVNATYATATCIATWVGAAHGLTGVSAGWFLGAFVATCVAVAASRQGRPNHRAPLAGPELASLTAEGIRTGDEGYVAEQTRRLARPANPFQPGYGRQDPPAINGAQPGMANGGYGTSGGYGRPVNGQQPNRMQPPGYPPPPGYDRANVPPGSGPHPRTVSGSPERPASGGYPRPVNGSPGPRGSGGYPAPVNGGTGPHVNGSHPGPVNGRPQYPVSGGYPGPANGGTGPQASGGYPGPANGEYHPRVNGERRLPADPSELDYDDTGDFPRRTSLWD